jgi:hypothetical protein
MDREIRIYQGHLSLADQLALNFANGDEELAWAAGVQLRQIGAPIASVLSLPRWAIDETLSALGLAALNRLGHDRWARWVRQGFDDAIDLPLQPGGGWRKRKGGKDGEA